MTCGHVKPITGAPPLVCNLEPGHALPHGVRQVATLPPYVTWTDANHTPASETWMDAERAAWRKPHKRKPTR